MKYTLAITTYQRFELLKESFAQVLTDPRIGEILILDDASDIYIYNQVKSLEGGKVKVIRQAVNRNMSRNKADAIAFAQFEWVIIFDSDNVISPAYLDAIPSELFGDTIYAPSFARPEFGFKQYEGLLFDRANVGKFINDPPFGVLLNCCNYLVNRDAYSAVYKYDPEVKGADTITFAYNWLNSGNKFYVVPDMEYYHRVHRGSGFMKDVNENMNWAEAMRKKIIDL